MKISQFVESNILVGKKRCRETFCISRVQLSCVHKKREMIARSPSVSRLSSQTDRIKAKWHPCRSNQNCIHTREGSCAVIPRRDDDVRAASNLKCHLLPVVGNNGLVSTFNAVPLSIYV